MNTNVHSDLIWSVPVDKSALIIAVVAALLMVLLTYRVVRKKK
jgi:hypothetical protein